MIKRYLIMWMLLIAFVTACASTGTEPTETPSPTATVTLTATVTPTQTMTATLTTPVVITRNAPAGCQIRTDWSIYTVISGDTLMRIANRYGSTVTALTQANCLANANNIAVGQQLRVPVTPVPSYDLVDVLPYISGINGTVTIPAGMTVNLQWQNAPQNATIVNFLYSSAGYTRPLGVDDNLTDGASFNWAVSSEEVSGILFAIAYRNNQVLQTSQSRNVTIQKPMAVPSISASPSTIPQGGSVILTWSVPGQTSVGISRSVPGQAGSELIQGNLPGSGTLTTIVPTAFIDRVDFTIHGMGTALQENYAHTFVLISPDAGTLACPGEQGTSSGQLVLSPDNRRSDGCTLIPTGQTVNISYPNLPQLADFVRFFFLPQEGSGCGTLNEAIQLDIDAVVYDGASVVWIPGIQNCAGLIGAQAQQGSGLIELRESPVIIQ